jgi:hypothetical protein
MEGVLIKLHEYYTTAGDESVLYRVAELIGANKYLVIDVIYVNNISTSDRDFLEAQKYEILDWQKDCIADKGQLSVAAAIEFFHSDEELDV